jgi:hypothetical protein
MNPKTAPFYNYYLRAAESLSPSLGIKLVPSLVENVADIERIIEAFARTPNGGLLLPPDTNTYVLTVPPGLLVAADEVIE